MARPPPAGPESARRQRLLPNDAASCAHRGSPRNNSSGDNAYTDPLAGHARSRVSDSALLGAILSENAAAAASIVHEESPLIDSAMIIDTRRSMAGLALSREFLLVSRRFPFVRNDRTVAGRVNSHARRETVIYGEFYLPR
jgi:hypothetical protein